MKKQVKIIQNNEFLPSREKTEGRKFRRKEKAYKMDHLFSKDVDQAMKALRELEPEMWEQKKIISIQ